jgi:hypothetical protein
VVYKNSFEVGFSRAKVYDVFTSWSLLGKSQTLALEKSVLKPFVDPRKKISMQKPTLPSQQLSFWSQRGLMDFWQVGVFQIFASWGFRYEANSKSAKGPKLIGRGPNGDGPKLGKLLRKTYQKRGQKRGGGQKCDTSQEIGAAPVIMARAVGIFVLAAVGGMLC